MSVVLLRGRNGKHRRHWYGEYVEDGKRHLFNLNVLVRGEVPASLKEPGDRLFERSRDAAEKALDHFLEENQRKGRAEHLTERLIQSKTGRAVEYARLEELSQRWRTLGRESAPSEAYLDGCDAVFKRLGAFMASQRPTAVYLYEVTAEDAGAYMTTLQAALARKTVRDHAKLLNKAFERFLPVGSSNPFAGFIGRRAAGESEMVHRKPFTPAELQAVLDAGRDDDFMYPLIVTAACSGMRRGDVCCLPWSAVDLDGGMLAVKTSKTGAEVEIPIFKPLREVLEARKGVHPVLVFPEAARMLETAPDGLTWRFKKIVARAFATADQPPPMVVVPAAEVLVEAEAAVQAKVAAGPRQERMLDVLRRYCGGESLREITRSAGYAKCTVSLDLHTIGKMIGKPFIRGQAPSVKDAVRATTQMAREKGQRAASVRDWHALRATFVTLALSAGVPVELVRRVTGHATVEVVLKHYFRPDREQFKAALTDAMPAVLTGVGPGTSGQSAVGSGSRATQGKQGAAGTGMADGEELVALAVKVSKGTATAAERARLAVLAARA